MIKYQNQLMIPSNHKIPIDDVETFVQLTNLTSADDEGRSIEQHITTGRNVAIKVLKEEFLFLCEH